MNFNLELFLQGLILALIAAAIVVAGSHVLRIARLKFDFKMLPSEAQGLTRDEVIRRVAVMSSLFGGVLMILGVWVLSSFAPVQGNADALLLGLGLLILERLIFFARGARIPEVGVMPSLLSSLGVFLVLNYLGFSLTVASGIMLGSVVVGMVLYRAQTMSMNRVVLAARVWEGGFLILMCLWAAAVWSAIS